MRPEFRGVSGVVLAQRWAIFPASHRDLLDSQVATLATIDDEGYPQLTEVWFLYDEGQVKVSVNTSRRKLHNLEQRPQCSLLVLDLQNPGTATSRCAAAPASSPTTTARSPARSARSTEPT